MTGRRLIKTISALAAACGLGFAEPALAAGEVVFASWGGSFQEALRSAMLAPPPRPLA